MRAVAIICLTLLLVSCGTKYQDMGFTGGVAAEQVTADTWRIVSRGNAYTSSTTIQDYVLLKAAETTKAAGGTHFLLIGASDASRVGVVTTPGTATTNVIGNTAFTTYNPGITSEYIKPGQDAYIRVLKGPSPGAFSADEIIKFTGPRVERG